ncbi:hypothetical protein [Pedosphaera parvula]|uniref:Aminopeptidase n=1 Tax=Pedosphaera parvula (strain Ellin514) TaxID=320771 RepID=B9XLE7_PEDPL|nr:hypothetical protein [Pedosphaera parvula]EEF59350.1 hypothetical protein Cflav_PD1898 [Pedosphaera parvula Ellin514]
MNNEKMTKVKWICSAAVVMALVSSCSTTRSISDTAYAPSPVNARNCFPPHPQTRELSEFDVLGIEPNQSISEEEIVRASARAQRVALTRGNSILLVQSGAQYPDGPMISDLEKSFRVVPFTGVATQTGESYSKVLRLAAAKAGADHVVCYWGILESASEGAATKTISWVPVVNWVIPDEKQHMRIRVKMAVVDVLTGSWTVFSPEPVESQAWSTSPRREVVDQKQVEKLKAKAYEASARGLLSQAVD